MAIRRVDKTEINIPEIDEVVVTTIGEPEPVAKSDEFIIVRAVGSNQYEPFQHISIPADYGVPVKMSSWVACQLKAGVIVEC